MLAWVSSCACAFKHWSQGHVHHNLWHNSFFIPPPQQWHNPHHHKHSWLPTKWQPHNNQTWQSHAHVTSINDNKYTLHIMQLPPPQTTLAAQNTITAQLTTTCKENGKQQMTADTNKWRWLATMKTTNNSCSTLPCLGYSMWNPWKGRWTAEIPDGFHGMVDGFHGFSTWIPYLFHTFSIWTPYFSIWNPAGISSWNHQSTLMPWSSNFNGDWLIEILLELSRLITT